MLYRLFLIILFSSIFGAGIAAGSEGARVYFPSSQFDFGEINQGDRVDHLFTFKNIGDETLIVGGVKTSCGCTVALPSKMNLLPNEDGELKVTFDSGRFYGKIHKEIYLSSNDKKNPRAKLVLTATIKPSITLTPDTINFDFITAEKKKAANLTITNRGNSILEITSIEVSNPSISVKPATAIVNQNEVAKFEITATAPNSGEKLSGYLLIHTNRVQQEVLRIPFYVKGTSL